MATYMRWRDFRDHNEGDRTKANREGPEVSLARESLQTNMTYVTNVNIAILDSVTSPVLRPKPTIRRETRAPTVEKVKSFLRPTRL